MTSNGERESYLENEYKAHTYAESSSKYIGIKSKFTSEWGGGPLLQIVPPLDSPLSESTTFFTNRLMRCGRQDIFAINDIITDTITDEFRTKKNIRAYLIVIRLD